MKYEGGDRVVVGKCIGDDLAVVLVTTLLGVMMSIS